ncbi:hypothetical protein BT67DRAFT_445541 [Trichocladium antarcticum]|uniref:Uncharacterized protein n=1 Tax=Trichocladium antarcticum TaxID=1450529 RepID=A0AAN6Z9C3_9PEZI|nr:hypothetical protein BT67DRAFT_445541 [Trichocladium antarcticum]
MCTIGHNTFSCGCRKPDPATLTRCEYAKLKGRACPDFQTSKDAARSRAFPLMACMRHS